MANEFKGVMALRMAHDYPHVCPRCKKNEFFITRDGDDYLVFCADNNCMKKDSEIAKEFARTKCAKSPERNNFGNIMTGAEKFSMGARYKNASLARLVMEDAIISSVHAWITSLNTNFVFLGGPGCGKTFLSAAVLNYLFEQKKEVFYTTHRRFIKYLQDGIGEDKSQYQLLNKIAFKHVLIFDDLGSAANTEWQKEMILELIDVRYSQKLPTLYTSNLGKEEMNELLGIRTASRLFSKENIVLEKWNTQDLRQNEEIECEGNQ